MAGIKRQGAMLPPCGSEVKFTKSMLEPNFQKVIIDMDMKDINIQKCPTSGSVLYSNPTAVVVIYSHMVLDDEQKEKITEIYIAPNQQDFFLRKRKKICVTYVTMSNLVGFLSISQTQKKCIITCKEVISSMLL